MGTIQKYILLCVALMGCNSNLWASDVATEESDSSELLPEVTVSAIKQTSDLNKFPTALTVLNTNHVERLGIDAIKNVSAISPNFFIPDYGSRMTSSVYVRGIGARIDQPVVGLNVDNVPILNKDNYDFELSDVDRIEVLRGPQSTLYGRNTMGGLINIYTISPFRFQGVRFMGEYGSAHTMKASLSYYTKLTSHLGMSVGGNVSKNDGFYDNMYNGADVGAERQGSFRWKTKWYPTSNTAVENVATVQYSQQSGYPYQSVESGEINYNDTCFYRRTTVTDGLTVNWNLNGVTMSSITSFQYINDNMTLDQDFLPLEYFTLTQKRHEWALTQDFVVKGTENNYNWLVGAFGFYRRTNMSAPVTFKEYGIEQLIEKNRNEANPYYPIAWNEPSFVLGSDFLIPTYGLALYHQSHYDLNRWAFTLGVRLDYENSTLDYNSFCNTSYSVYDNTGDVLTQFANNAVAIDDYGHLNQSFIEVLPKLNHEDDGCREMITGEGGVIQRYLERGISGWRLDVADELSNRVLDEIREGTKKENPEAVIIGEVWENACDKIAYGKRRRYFSGRQLDSVMNYPLKNAIIAFCQYGDGEMLYNTLTEIYASYPKCVSDKLMNLLGTHDTERIITMLGSDIWELDGTNDELATKRLSFDKREYAIELLKIASAIQYTVYGIPSVFYGDEVGLEGYHDPFCRMPYPWDDIEGTDREQIRDYYTLLGKIRNENKAFDGGDFYVIRKDESSLIYAREKEDNLIIVALNRGKSFSIDIPPSDTYTNLLTGKVYTGAVRIPADTAMIFKVT